ncbi:MAG TPA: aspartate carbamoyltransferase [Candidatus Bathyarchaeia archaeon]|nr:aspartate carbamoyltransferase [Candidatus Bathyarchaeia archaeon]
MRHILNAEQFTPAQLSELFEGANYFRQMDQKIATRREIMQRHFGRIMLSMFYEPSTRTFHSFDIAAIKLGIKVSGSQSASEFSSAAKGETIEDTVRVFNEYGVDAMTLRTKNKGEADIAASVATIPILNGGDGKGEHPTQAALDAYTINSELGQLHNLNVVIGGDLVNGRTARSLAQVLSKFPGNDITFLAPPEFQIGDDIKAKLDKTGTRYTEMNTLDIDAFGDADAIYWTRLQLERLGDTMNKEEAIEKQLEFTIDAKTLKVTPEHAIIMHPLPRVKEISTEVDDDRRAKYFRQAGNGLYIRMAMLDQIMNDADVRG